MRAKVKYGQPQQNIDDSIHLIFIINDILTKNKGTKMNRLASRMRTSYSLQLEIHDIL